MSDLFKVESTSQQEPGALGKNNNNLSHFLLWIIFFLNLNLRY